MYGCRPTSVTIQPHSSATTAAMPDTAVARRNQGDLGMSRLKSHVAAEPQPQQHQGTTDAHHDVERPVEHRVGGGTVVRRDGVAAR